MLVVEIHPRVIGQPYGLGDEDVFVLLLASRLKAQSLFPIKPWPCEVCVFRVLDDRALGGTSFEKDQVEMMTWGRI